MKRKRVQFADEHKTSTYNFFGPEDNGLRSPGHEDKSYCFFKNTSSPKSILKRKRSEQKELPDSVLRQDQQEKILFHTLYQGLKKLLTLMKKHIPDKKTRRNARGLFIASLADFQLNLLKSRTYQVAGMTGAKQGLVFDLYFGARKLSKHKSIIRKAEDVFAKFKSVHKTRSSYSGGEEYNCFKNKKRDVVARTLLKEYINSTIGITRGSNFENCIKEFIDLVSFLFEKFSNGKIVSEPEIIKQMQSILNEIQIDLSTIQIEIIKQESSTKLTPKI